MSGEPIVGQEPSLSGSVESLSFWRSPRWRVALIGGLNMLLLPPCIMLLFLRGWIGFPAVDYGMQSLAGVYHAQIFLLATWMTFGGSPKRWRRLWMSVALIVYGLFYLLTLLGVAYFYLNDFPPPGEPDRLLLLLLGVPTMMVFVLWCFHLLLLWPQWYFGVVIDFQQHTPHAPRVTRQLSILHFLSLIFFVAIPLGAFRFLSASLEMFNFQQVAAILLPFAILMAIGLPLLLVHLSPRPSRAAMLIADGWFSAAAIGLAALAFVLHGAGIAIMAIAAWVTILFNTFLWRSLGLRWLPHEPPPSIDQAAPQAPTAPAWE